MSGENEWRWADPRGQQRPVQADELRAALAAGSIAPNAPVWRRGWKQWIPAHDVPELQTSAQMGGLAAGAAQLHVAGRSLIEEPPPPPRYIPLVSKPPVAKANTMGTNTPAPHPARPRATPAPAKKTIVGIAPTTARTSSPSAPPSSGSAHLKRAVPSAPKSSPGTSKVPTPARPEPMVIEPEANTSVNLTAVTEGQATETLARADAVPPPRDGVRTVVGVPVIQDPRGAKGKPGDKAKAVGSGALKPKRQTLIQFGGAPSSSEADDAASPPGRPERTSQPIVVPAPGAQAGKNAVTRPPPWGEGAVEIGPAIPKSPPVPRLHRDESVEELSGSMLVEQTEEGPMVRRLSPSNPPPAVRSSAPALAGRVSSAPPPEVRGQSGATAPMPAYLQSSAPPRDMPAAGGYGGSISLETIPSDAPSPLMKRVFARWPYLERVQQGKPRFFFPVIFGLGLLVVVIGGVALVKAVTAPSSRTAANERANPAARVAMTTAGASASAAAPEKKPEVIEVPPPAAAAAPPCSIVGQPKSIAPQVVVQSGVEVAATGQGLALGFASAPKEAVTLLLDPATLATSAEHTTKAADVVRRVTPVPPAHAGGKDGSPAAAISLDRKGDAIEGRRTSSGPAPVDFGVANGHLVWAARGESKSSALWALAGDGPVEALRAVPLDGAERGYAITFRRGTSIWTGVVAAGDKSLVTKGELTEIKGLGPQVGSPSIAASGDTVLVLWADRANADEPWSLRYQRWQATGTSASDRAAEAAKTFNVPAGGLGAPFMSPGVTSLGQGRFLVVWTEGPVSSHQVRAQTLDADGALQGSAFTVSSEGANAGQGQATVLPDGRGAVAYLVAGGKGFELMATSVSCPRP
ncbi:GYF domain-containing protein [Pendulispora brunnea]|uniref:GYF domain-containing protein n=1 Tax=Pendulispora brunnea TaxID=2905690 RepID=A0ABZ2K472_9BACT